jgi:hypothetical protein
LFTIIGIGVGTFFLFLLFISTFGRWVPGQSGSIAGHSITVPGISGTHFGDGRVVLLLSLVFGVAVGLNFLTRKFLPLTMTLAGAFGTFVFMVMLSWIGAGGWGVILGLIAAAGIMGGCIWTAVRFPLPLEVPGAATQPAFMRAYGALMVSQTAALVLGLLYLILMAVSRVGAVTPR